MTFHAIISYTVHVVAPSITAAFFVVLPTFLHVLEKKAAKKH